MEYKTVEVLGQLLNYDVGKSGVVPSANVATVKGRLNGDQLHLTFVTMMTYDRADRARLQGRLKSLRDESNKVLTDYIAQLKKDFRAAAGYALKLTEIDRTDDLQVTSYNTMTPKATGCFRHMVKLGVG